MMQKNIKNLNTRLLLLSYYIKELISTIKIMI